MIYFEMWEMFKRFAWVYLKEISSTQPRYMSKDLQLIMMKYIINVCVCVFYPSKYKFKENDDMYTTSKQLNLR